MQTGISRLILSIFFLLSLTYQLLALRRETIKCPNRCQCVSDAIERNRSLVSCKWDRINLQTKLFSDFTFNLTKSLSIECTETGDDIVSELTDDLFAEFTNLQNLHIQNCRVRLLPINLFRGLNNLRSLSLHAVALPKLSLTLSQGLFDGLKRLEKLSLTSSHIQAIPAKALCSLTNLQILNVSSNWLTNAKLGLDPECPAKQLIIVDISKNRIETINMRELDPLEAVRQLVLSNNEISYTHRESLRNCTLLQHLYLDGNRIEEVPQLPDKLIHVNVARNNLNIIASTIANLPNLISLNISDNNIDTSTPFTIISDLLETLDLSHNRFEQIPLELIGNSSTNLSQLKLASNRIARIEPKTFSSFTKLKTLDMHSNRLTQIDEGCLEGLVKLKQIILSNNSIFEIALKAFDSTQEVTELDLSQNLLLEMPLAVVKLLKLKTLNISSNQISKTYKFIFNKLPYLEVLDMSHNKISAIESYVFSDIQRLRQLLINDNSIDRLAKDSFAKCPLLEFIDLTGNFIHNLNNALSTMPMLKRLKLNSNLMEMLQWDQFPSSLTDLEIINNQIALLGAALNSNLKVIKLQNNRITMISNQQLPSSFDYLNISKNLIEKIPNSTFVAIKNAKTIDISYNRLSNIRRDSFVTENIKETQIQLYLQGNPLICTCEMDWILPSQPDSIKSNIEILDMNETNCKHRIQNTNISLISTKREDLLCTYETVRSLTNLLHKKFSIYSLNKKKPVEVCEPNCICCLYGNCDCKSKCPKGCVCYHDATYNTNIVRCVAMNEADRKDFALKDLPMYASHIFLEQMNLSIIRSHDFLGRIRLLQLYINSSSVKEIQKLAFNTLPSLQILDLSKNELGHLTGNEMKRTHKLTHLFLNNNQITILGDRVSKTIPALQYLTLHDNQLKDLPTVIEKYGEKIAGISLANNPYRCDCGTRFRLQSWLGENLERIVDAENILCVENVTRTLLDNDTTVLSSYPPNKGDDLFVMPMMHFNENLNRTICLPTVSGVFGKDTTVNSLLIISLVLITLLIITGLVTIITMIIRKWKSMISERRYKMSNSFHCTQITPGSSPMPLIHFDAFLSYAKKDEKLVVDGIAKPLEREDYLLCLLHRDGSPHTNKVHLVSDELIKQMECSQSLILVLTKHFLENEWKTLQIKTSHRLFAKNRSKKLIAILGEGVEPNQLDAELGQILRKNTCIRYNDPLLWNLLHSALPMRTAPSSASADSSQIYSDCYGSIVPSDIV